MGNQPSKDSKSGSRPSLDVPGPNLDSYPSLGKSDTKESSRSFRGLRSKIPGAGKSDSPRASVSNLSEVSSPEDGPTEKEKDKMDGIGPGSGKSRTDSGTKW